MFSPAERGIIKHFSARLLGGSERERNSEGSMGLELGWLHGGSVVSLQEGPNVAGW